MQEGERGAGLRNDPENNEQNGNSESAPTRNYFKCKWTKSFNGKS